AAFASCLPTLSDPTAPMACCENGRHDCASAMQAVDCCRSHDAASRRLTAANPVNVFKPVLSLTEVALPSSLLIFPLRVSPVIASFVAPSPPLFLLDSSLRI